MNYKVLLLSLILVGCTTDRLREGKVAVWSDDLDLIQFKRDLHRHIESLKKLKKAHLDLVHLRIEKKSYVAQLQKFQTELGTRELGELISRNFRVLEVVSDREGGKILLTGYFSPDIPGSLTPTTSLSQAIYRKPTEPKLSRKQIDEQQVLKGQKLEICYVDPVDAFVLQVQGSGRVRLTDGSSLLLNYAGTNGFPYNSIGRTLSQEGVFQKEDVTLEKIESYLRKLDEKELRRVLSLNERYIYFIDSPTANITSFGVSAVPGRTIATDQKLFSKGFLAFLEFLRPSEEGFVPTSRLVLDQDTGNAIKGPGRVDLFWGEGQQAKSSAGVMKHPARLFYLIPK